MPKIKQPTTDENQTTREMILNKSLELINQCGMVDFRIDSLATMLDLSPGNITYHFSKKEDICVALWSDYLKEYHAVERQLTTLIDLKQLFLLNRMTMLLGYKYRGVLIFRSSDLGAIARDVANQRNNQDFHHNITTQILKLLQYNGYVQGNLKINDITDITDSYHYLIMRWGINFLFQKYSSEEVELHIDELSLLVTHAYFPYLTERGRNELMEIYQTIKSGKLQI